MVDNVTVSNETRQSAFFKRFVTTFGLGLPGIVAVGVSSIDSLRELSQLSDLSTSMFFLVSVFQPLVLLAIACLVGTALAHRVRLRSHVLARVAGETRPVTLFAAEVPIAAGVGGIAALVALALDLAFVSFVPELTDVIALSADGATVASVLASVPVRFLYGGITEELLVRYGFMSLVAWTLSKLVADERPSAGVMWTAIAVSAVFFGLGHLPALAASAPLTPLLVGRTVLLNAVAGIGFGWLYWQQSLESAMVGHVAFHVVVVAASLLLVL
ncbi:CPBP family intramembrane glutamic endopeptidase [Haladaptatus sp. NG-WS-4]